MKDLSRAEELKQLISRTKDACENKKWLRVKKTFFVLSGVIYVAAFMFGEISDKEHFFEWLIIAPILAALTILISLGVLYHIITGAMTDEKSIARLEGELNATIRFDKNSNKE